MVRGLVSKGEFVEVFVDTPIDECIRRDPKGLYAKAKDGKIKNFTGVNAPYQAPPAPEIHLHTVSTTPMQMAETVLAELIRKNIIPTAHGA